MNTETADSDANRAFYLHGWFDKNGSLRANDLQAATGDTKTDLAKLYDFIAGKTKTSLKNTDPYANYKNECTCSMQSLLMATQTYSSDDCKSCTAKISYQGYDVEGIFNENGKVVYYSSCQEGNKDNCGYVTFNDDGSVEELSSCNSNNFYKYIKILFYPF